MFIGGFLPLYRECLAPQLRVTSVSRIGLEEDFPDNWITLYISSLQFPLTFQRAKMGLIVLLSSLSALQVLIFPGFCS